MLRTIKGVHGPFAHKDQQGANQDGADWIKTTFDKGEVDMEITISARTPRERRRIFREWLDAWSPYETGRLTWFTQDMGHWWMDLRHQQEPRDVLPPDFASNWPLDWAARYDFPFWASFDSIAETPAGWTGGQWFANVRNRGDMSGWPRYLLQGPGVFSIADNGPTGPTVRTITIEVKTGEVVLITTLPRKRTATELNTKVNVYPRLKNRFSRGVKGGAAVSIPISATGTIAGKTAVKVSLTPYRRWPE
jgi:hypothetical protein